LADPGVGPFRFVTDEEARDGKISDAIMVVASVEDDRFWLTCPQFEIEVCGDEPKSDEDIGALVIDLIQRIVSFYSGLRSLPPGYINEVENAQLALIETAFLPWLADRLGRNTGYWSLPTEESNVSAADFGMTPA
jgi:hypothetical protein